MGFKYVSKKELDFINCANKECKKLFQPTRSWQKTCSDSCRWQLYVQNKEAKRKTVVILELEKNEYELICLITKAIYTIEKEKPSGAINILEKIMEKLENLK